MNDEWQTNDFRQSVVNKINELLQSTGRDLNQNAAAMENHLFNKAKSREEYLALFAKFVMQLKELKNRSGKVQQSSAQVNDMGNPNMIPDPINALQNLASQGTRNSQMLPVGNQSNQPPVAGNAAASNLLQNLNQQRPTQQQIPNLQGIRNQMNVPIGSGIQQNSVQNPMNVQMTAGINSGNPSLNINVMGNQSNQLGNCLPAQMASNQMQINSNMQGQIMPQMPINNMNQNSMNMGINHPQMNQMINRMGTSPQINIGSNVGNQNPITNQLNVQQNMPNISSQGQMHQIAINSGTPGINTGSINSQGNLNQMMNMTNLHNQNKSGIAMGQGSGMFPGNRTVSQNHFLRQSPSPTVTSPATISQQSQLANSQMIPSPALVPSSSPQMPNIMNNNKRALRQSPNATLNTPGQVTASSPFNPQEDQMYREKYIKLTKYIEPLKRMVAKIGNDDVEKISKLNKLLEILCDPHQRIPLETLLKCEKALDKMDFKSCFSQAQFGTTNQLVDVINSTLQSSLANHTLYRTFHPPLESLFGSDIKCGYTTAKQRRSCNIADSQDIPHTLQGEIARLDQKFKVSLDAASQNNKTIKLICCLDDKLLPCVPPLCVIIPEKYPYQSPNCSLTAQEYQSTPFLETIHKVLAARIGKFPKLHSLSHLLDTWEMSVRQACSPSTMHADISAFLFA